MNPESHETTLWDVTQSCVRALYRACLWCLHLIGKMVRLSVRRWWIVGPIIILAAAAGLYYSRTSNKMYKVNAIVTLNGPTRQEVRTYYESLRPDFEAYDIIDYLHDGTADMVDFRRKHSPSDTANVVVVDQLALQFITRRPQEIPYWEDEIIRVLNEHPQFIAAYAQYKQHADRQYEFDQAQVDKLDEMTTAFYSSAGDQQVQSNARNLTMGRKEIMLPLKDIEAYMKRKQQRDTRYALTTAPIVLHSHFAPERKAINGRLKFTGIGLLIGWLLGCLIAFLIDERRSILQWLRKE